MTTTDRARFFAGEYPRRRPRRMRLRARALYGQYTASGRIAVVPITGSPIFPWAVIADGHMQNFPGSTTHQQALDFAHLYAKVRAERAIVNGAS